MGSLEIQINGNLANLIYAIGWVRVFKDLIWFCWVLVTSQGFLGFLIELATAESSSVTLEQSVPYMIYKACHLVLSVHIWRCIFMCEWICPSKILPTDFRIVLLSYYWATIWSIVWISLLVCLYDSYFVFF